MHDALRRTPGWSEVRRDLDDATLEAVLDEAAKLAETVVAPLNRVSDREGARFEQGVVRVPEVYRGAYATLAAGGWIALEHDEAFGGQGLPLSLFVAVNTLFERASPAFMMAVGGSRAAALLLSQWADKATREHWVPDLLAGQATATICISEPEAGSDIGRIRTRATHSPEGWTVTGQKIWISFGDHDIGPRIGHCLLARSNDTPGPNGLSLFLVPKGPGVTTNRIEEKLGLHGSPTCALGFERAPAILLGTEGQGLRQIFTMIRHMRLMVACQGLGTALLCLDVARNHAETRRQGGNPSEPPVPLVAHADVRRQISEIASRVDLFRLVLMETAVAADRSGGDPDHARLQGLLLPLIKNFGAELAFDAAARATLILGGLGYTKDTPVEQALRDARVFAIYEGTTGMQAQDFLLRQCLRDDCAAILTLRTIALAECGSLPETASLVETFSRFVLDEVRHLPRSAQIAMAEPAMRAAWVAVEAWMATRIPESAATARFLAVANERLALHIAAARNEACAAKEA